MEGPQIQIAPLTELCRFKIQETFGIKTLEALQVMKIIPREMTIEKISIDGRYQLVLSEHKLFRLSF